MYPVLKLQFFFFEDDCRLLKDKGYVWNQYAASNQNTSPISPRCIL